MPLALELLPESESKKGALEGLRGHQVVKTHSIKQGLKEMVLDRKGIRWPYIECLKKQIHAYH